MDRARLVLDRSASGAPAAGRAARDLFSTDEIFQRLVHTADEEFSRPARLLFLSGLAAGLAISFSFVGSAMLAGQTGSIALGHLRYPLGFLIVVMGREWLLGCHTGQAHPLEVGASGRHASKYEEEGPSRMNEQERVP